jgi:copper transport protein
MTHTSYSRPARGRRRAAIIGLLAALAVLLAQSPAAAHAALLRSSPGAGTTVPEAPSEVVLTFSEPISPVNDKIRIIGPDGERADRGTPSADGPTLRIQLRDNAPRGTYLVSYRVISADSHPVPGGFTFSVGAPSATAPTLPEEKIDDTVTNLLALAKYTGYLGLVLLVGAALVLTLLWPSRLGQRGPRRLLWTGFGLVALGTIAGVYLQAPYTTGVSVLGATGGDLADVLESRYGVAGLVRLACLVVSAILLRPLLAGRGGKVDRALLLIVAVIGAVTWPLAGHPAASPVPAVSVVVDSLHLAAAAVWVGGLVMLAAFLLPKAKEQELSAILPIWSRWAALAVSTLLIAGVISALIEVGTPTALIDTSYGRLVLVKVGLVGLMLGAAAVARRLIQNVRSWRGGLRRSVMVEVAIGVVVLGVTSFLTQTTPARTAEAIAAQQAAQPQLFSSTVTTSLYSLQVEIDPAKRGQNTVHLYAYTLDNKPLPVVEWTASAALPSAGVEPVAFTLLKITDNHSTGIVSLPTAGDWQLRFTLRLSDIDQASVTVTVPVS